MATYKRRVVYLSDEEWSKVNQRAVAFNLSSSAYIRKLIEWRQPGPALQPEPLTHTSSFVTFRPAPKPGRKP